MSSARIFRHARSFLPGGDRPPRVAIALLAGLIAFYMAMLLLALVEGLDLRDDFAAGVGRVPARWVGEVLVVGVAMAGVLMAIIVGVILTRPRDFGCMYVVDEEGIMRRNREDAVGLRWTQVRQLREARWAPRRLVIVADHARVEVRDTFLDEAGPHAELVRRVWSGRMARLAFLAHGPLAQSHELRDLVKARAPRAELIRWPPCEGFLAMPLMLALMAGMFMPFYRLRAFEAVDGTNVRIACHDAAGALAEADRAVAIEPQWGLAHAARADALAALDRLDEALSAADRAVALDPQVPDAHRTRSRLLEKAGRHREAAHELLHVGIAGDAGRTWRTEITRLLEADRESSPTRTESAISSVP